MYICYMINGKDKGLKSLKISETVHKKLKVYCATSGDNMTEVADTAILAMITVKSETKSFKNKQK